MNRPSDPDRFEGFGAVLWGCGALLAVIVAGVTWWAVLHQVGAR